MEFHLWYSELYKKKNSNSAHGPCCSWVLIEAVSSVETSCSLLFFQPVVRKIWALQTKFIPLVYCIRVEAYISEADVTNPNKTQLSAWVVTTAWPIQDFCNLGELLVTLLRLLFTWHIRQFVFTHCQFLLLSFFPPCSCQQHLTQAVILLRTQSWASCQPWSLGAFRLVLLVPHCFLLSDPHHGLLVRTHIVIHWFNYTSLIEVLTDNPIVPCM